MISELRTKDIKYEVGKNRVSRIEFNKQEAGGIHVYKLLDADRDVIELIKVKKGCYHTKREEEKPSQQITLFDL